MSNLFEASKRESAVDLVVNSIKQLLMERTLKPGDKLPSELEISEELRVSRGSVREAMKILSAFGLVDIRVGNGTYVCETPLWIPFCSVSLSPIRRLMTSMSSDISLKTIFLL